MDHWRQFGFRCISHAASSEATEYFIRLFTTYAAVLRKTCKDTLMCGVGQISLLVSWLVSSGNGCHAGVQSRSTPSLPLYLKLTVSTSLI